MFKIVFFIIICLGTTLFSTPMISKTIVLTEKEKNFIKNNKFIASTTVKWVPFNYESKDEKIVGISVEYLRLIAQKVGLSVNLKKENNFTNVLQNIKNKTSDMTISSSATNNRENYAVFTKPYESFPIAIAVRSDTAFIQKTSFLEGKKVAVGKDYSAHKLLKEKYPLIKFVTVSDTNEALKLVDKHEVYAAVDILPVLQQAILSNNNVDGIKIGGITDVDFHLQIMIRDDLKMLKNIMDKAIDSINSGDRNLIYKGWITSKEVIKFDYDFLYKVIFLFIVTILIIIFWNNKLRIEVKKRKEAEKIIIEEKEKLSSILSLIPIPILITDLETKEIVFANKYSKKQYKIDEKEEIVGKKIDFLYTSMEQREEILSAMDENYCVNEFETQYKLNNGEIIDALLSTIPISYNHKDSILGIISDITNIKRFQKELEDQRNIADDARKSMSDFLANMSHEIRTPLNAIVGFIDILKESVKGEENLKYLNIIDKSSYSLLGVINDILDFSKIQNGKIDLEKIDFNPKEEFQNIAYLFEATAQEKSINFTLNIDCLPEYVNSDILRIKQVVLNLLSNAIKFTSSNKSVTLEISYKNGFMYINVKDEGIGISNEKLNTIFDSFTQEDNSTTRRFGGTGLGLSISKELVLLLGGELKVKSTQGKGSEFYFSIPVTIGKEVKELKVSKTMIEFSKEQVLLVEDNPANQMFMKVILKKMNLEFTIANDGKEAIDLFKKGKYAIILMDENMPNMNGIEATKWILEYEKINNLEHTPIIALTANAIKGDREKFLEAGMDSYLTKPVDKIKLNNEIKEMLHV